MGAGHAVGYVPGEWLLDGKVAGSTLEEVSVLGISAYCAALHRDQAGSVQPVRAVAECVRHHAPAAKVVLGGHLVTLAWQRLAREHAFIDYMILGPGEVPFRRLVETLLSGVEAQQLRAIPGLVFRDASGEPRANPIGSLDWLADLDPPVRSEDARGSHDVVLARGCHYGRCSFCAIGHCHGYLPRPIRAAMDEVEELCTRERRPHVRFIDEHAIRRLDAVCTEIEERGLELRFSINARAPDLLRGSASLDRARRAGLLSVEVGIESFSPEVLEHLQKGVRAEDNLAALELLFEHGILKDIDFIALTPWTTRTGFIHSAALLLDHGVYRAVHEPLHPAAAHNLLQIYEGTALGAAYDSSWTAIGDEDVQRLVQLVRDREERLYALHAAATEAHGAQRPVLARAHAVRTLRWAVAVVLGRDSTEDLWNDLCGHATSTGDGGGSGPLGGKASLDWTVLPPLGRPCILDRGSGLTRPASPELAAVVRHSPGPSGDAMLARDLGVGAHAAAALRRRAALRWPRLVDRHGQARPGVVLLEDRAEGAIVSGRGGVERIPAGCVAALRYLVLGLDPEELLEQAEGEARAGLPGGISATAHEMAEALEIASRHGHEDGA